MKKFFITLMAFILSVWIIYATITTANFRKSPKLPWQWTASWYYDSAHNVWISNLPEARFVIYTWSLSLSWVTKDNITWLFWQSITNTNNSTICKNYDTSEYNNLDSCSDWTLLDDCNFCAAKKYCENLELWWFNDWRVPNIKELSSIINYSKVHPALDVNYFTWYTISDSDLQSSTIYDSSNFMYISQYDWTINYLVNSLSKNTKCVR